jgi:O-acetyl-ADP-ribose deacetylase (regulator of RNase III)
VIHTVGPIYRFEADPAPLLASCYVESLRVADELGARTVAFPAISAGAFGYPMDDAADVAMASVRGASSSVEVVRFVLFDQRAFDAFDRAFRASA